MLSPKTPSSATFSPDASLPVILPPTESEPASNAAKTKSKTIPVLHVVNGEHYAGAERVQDLLARNLPDFGFSVGFACVKLDLFDEMREFRNAPLWNVPMHGRFDMLAALRTARLVRRGGYRLLHAHTVRAALIGGVAAALGGVPMVYHVHSPASRDSTRRWMNALNGLVERLSLRRAARVIAVSQAMAEHVAAEGLDRSIIRVAPNGVPAVKNLPRRAPPGPNWTLGVAALFRPRKGLETLLNAMTLLRRRGITVKLRAVGSFETPAYAAEIAELVRKLDLAGQIAWTGFTRDVTAELLKMDLFVLPSLFGEGLPMVVLESMAAGVPVVSTRVAGIPEAIRDGQDGALAEPGDAEDLARAIAAVIGNRSGRYDWSAMRASALARHAELFSDRGMAASVAAVYRELLPD